MSEAERAAIEESVRALHAAKDFDGAATATLKAYGNEIFRFLSAVHRDETMASDAFALFAEGIWRGLPAFTWSSSLRTWAYAVARYSGSSVRRDAGRRNKRVGLIGDSALGQIAQAVRTQTLEFLRTEKRSRLVALRDSLSEEDRALLILRVDRGLSWNELASVLSPSETPLDEAAILREAARLRKRFQVMKDKLREMARREGLTR
jgi:RNA polymerase sigma-70 factor (ECF subfamily)